jgi:hypothetical protein
MEQAQHGPAERIIQATLNYADHMVHNRPGFVVDDPRSPVGVRWQFCTHKDEDDGRVIYTINKVGRRTNRTRVGVMNGSQEVRENGRVVGRYQPAGIFPEVAAFLYKQVADIWQLDNEFAARWASYSYAQEHKDRKVVMAAFLLVQSRRGDPIIEDGERLFDDQDLRAIGEAMMLLYRRGSKYDLDPKLLLRVRDVLYVPAIAKLNYELGFAKSDRKPFLGRYYPAVRKWLRFREENPKMVEGLVKSGQKHMVRRLAIISGYKPLSERFFELLEWKQDQSKHHAARAMAIGKEVAAAESWEGLSETEVCEKIEKDKPSWKRIIGLLPKSVGVTRAVVACAIEAGSFSDKDLIIASPTLEDLGLLQVQSIRERWKTAMQKADDLRAANIARNVKSTENKEALQEGADEVMKKAVEEVTRDMRIYVFVDRSSSMLRRLG